MRTDYCGLIDKRYLTQTVTIKGWAHVVATTAA